MRKKYDWEEWFKHTHTVLMRGVHYACSQSTMAQTIRNNASMRGLRVQLIDTGVAIIVKVMERRESGEVLHTDRTPVVS